MTFSYAKFTTFFLLMTCLNAAVYGREHMPMPNQYNSLELYQQALKAWETAHRAQVACSDTVQLPPMPMPTQYNDLNLYREALAVWESVGSAHRTPTDNDNSRGSNVRIDSMPQPRQYNNITEYQRALKSWFAVSQKLAQHVAVQPPPMPMPDAYNDMSQYNEAMHLWEQLFSK
jgi:hypothetical protein